MAISALGNRAGMTSATTGTGSAIALGTALGAVAANICSYEDFSTAGITNGQQVTYLLLDNNGNWEVGNATYNSSGPQLTSRTVITGSSGASPINLTGNQQVFLTALKSDIGQTSILHVDADQSTFLTSANRGFGAANLQVLPLPQGRVTLSSGVPVLSSTVSGATTVYYTPYQGSTIPIYNGTNFEPWSFSELSQATTDATKSPASVAASKVYDIFVWNDAGTLRATRGPAWSSDTARGTGAGTTELVLQNGILLNKITITNGPAASRGTYVGSIRSNGSSTIDFIFGAAASGGTAGFLGVWNCYNRRMVSTTVTDNGATYNYQTATIRQARASAGNQISFLAGLNEDGMLAIYTAVSQLTGDLASFFTTSIGYDTITSNSTTRGLLFNAAVQVLEGLQTSSLAKLPGLGFHYVAAVEQGDGTHFNTGNADSANELKFQFMM